MHFMRRPLCLLLLISNMIANEFVVQSFQSEKSDLAARRYERIDVNDIPCAIIKIRTDIPKPFVFDANLGVEGDILYQEDGEIWVYVSDGERQLTIAKDGFVPLHYTFPERIEKWNVYGLVLRAKDNKLPVVIISIPDDAEKWVDGDSLGIGENFDLEIGERKLTLKKKGFRTLERQITVEEGNLLFRNLELEQIDVTPVTITTIPEGASIYVNGDLKGQSPWSDFIFPGSYSLKLTYPGYVDVDKSIVIKEKVPNELSYTLEKNTAILNLTLSPEDARVLINKRSYDDSRQIELAPGKYQVEVKREGYFSIKDNIEVFRNQKLDKTYSLQVMNGSLQFSIAPSDAQVMLKKQDGSVFSEWQGLRLIRELPVGPYEIQASHANYITQNRDIVIEYDERAEVNMELVSYAGSIQQSLNKKKWFRNLSGATTLLLGGAALYMKMESNGLYDDYQAARLPQEAVSLYEDANSKHQLSGMLGLATGATLGVTLYFQFDVSRLTGQLK